MSWFTDPLVTRLPSLCPPEEEGKTPKVGGSLTSAGGSFQTVLREDVTTVPRDVQAYETGERGSCFTSFTKSVNRQRHGRDANAGVGGDPDKVTGATL